MKLFLDTVEKYNIFALLDENDKVFDFRKELSNQLMVKETIYLLDKFLKKNNLKITDIDDFYFTIGPGSFTGIKVAYNIIGTIDLVNKLTNKKEINFYTINSFDLLNISDKNKVLVKLGKRKYFYKKYFWIFSKEKILQQENILNFSLYQTYENLDDELLQEKIKSNAFIHNKNFNDISLKFN